MTLRRFLKPLLRAFAALAFAAALVIGPGAVASAEQREVTSQAYKDCIDRGMGVDGAQYELVIEACCIGAGTDSETLKDGNGDAFMCVETVTNEGNTSPPPPSKGPASVPKVEQPGLAPPPTPTTTPLIAPAPAPGLAPR